jgi:aryl-alcohol dehydrogenase-like predicted oxidoreductase
MRPARRGSAEKSNIRHGFAISTTAPRPWPDRVEVSVLGFGTAPLGDLFLQLDDHTAIAAATRAFELGINLLDTSPLYGYGLSEHRCGTALRCHGRTSFSAPRSAGRPARVWNPNPDREVIFRAAAHSLSLSNAEGRAMRPWSAPP